MKSTFMPILDAKQLSRIESVHRGFLYQHLYAVALLLLANSMDAISIVVERDEDVEIVSQNSRIYIQVKTRSSSLKFSDIESALHRFDSLRIEHREGRRNGTASFIFAANVAPGPDLIKRFHRGDWPDDVKIHWPDNSKNVDQVPFAPWNSIAEALNHCTELAASLPYTLLAPATLVWKLAGYVMAASAGNPPYNDHTFQVEGLPILFEQVIFQLQDFPAPPSVYRPHTDEPPLESLEWVRIVTGYSGSGKTSWVSQAAIHATNSVIYFDATERAGSDLASALAREIAARLLGRTGGQLGEILLPGATGLEILHTIGKRISATGQDVTIVIDNAHRILPADLQTLIKKGSQFKFLLLCQPGRHVNEIESRLSITAEPLRGWENDTIALEVADQKCRADYAVCQRLYSLTAGMPLYVKNAIAIAKSNYGGSISVYCEGLEAKTHIVETAQELILTQVFEALPPEQRDGIAALSFSDIPLVRSDVIKLLANNLELEEAAAAILLRQLRSSGCIEIFGDDRLKIHDAIRFLGQLHLESSGKVKRAKTILKDVLSESLNNQWEFSKLFLYLSMLAGVGDIKTLVQLATDELFHELGVHREILEFLDEAASSEITEPEDRFWALDGLVFSDFKQGNFEKTLERIELMDSLICHYSFGADERLALSMKRMNLLAIKNDADGVLNSIDQIFELLPETQEHQRIFRYNAAFSLFKLGHYDATIEQTLELIEEYYDAIGLNPENIIGKNPDKIWPLLKKSPDLPDNLKHLADCLDLHATALSAIGGTSPFGRIHAMKFYDLANAPDSLIRVGQDLVDEFVGRNDFIGAREIIETNLLPNIRRLKMLDKVIPVRSQYAVVLAYCGAFDAADDEMSRLAPYEAGLKTEGQRELQTQQKLISELRVKGPPPQWIPEGPKTPTLKRRKIGRNEPCLCGSGKKYKKCCWLKN